MKLIFSSAIALVYAGSTTAAFAEVKNNPRYGEVTAVVKFADLNLANPADAQILLERIDTTARKVCLRANAGTSLEIMKHRKLCTAASYESGIAAVNAKKSIDVEALAAQASISREIVVAD